MRTYLAWSSGKDSAWALHLLRAQNVEVAGLLTTITEPRGRVNMHEVPAALVRAQAEAARLPLKIVALPEPCPNDAYEAAMAGALAELRAEGVAAIAFGDLFLEDIRAYREQKLAPTGMTPLFPLWRIPTQALARQMIEGGLRAHLVSVDTQQLDADFAGRDFDAALLAELPAAVDPCGENGEFHTFAYAGPMFARPVRFESKRTLRGGRFAYAEIAPPGAPAAPLEARGTARSN